MIHEYFAKKLTISTGILRHCSESSNDNNSQKSESTSPEPSPAFVLTSTFFATLSPEMCVDLLRHTSPKVYKNVRKKISEADNNWIEVSTIVEL